MFESVTQLFGSLPTRKEMDFDVQGHLQKEAFLREQLRMEKRKSRDELTRLHKLNSEIKSESRLVLRRLKSRLDELERENMHYKTMDRSLRITNKSDIHCINNTHQSMNDVFVAGNARERSCSSQEVDEFNDADNTFQIKNKVATPHRQIQVEDHLQDKEDHSMSPLLITDSIFSSLTNDQPAAVRTLERRPSLVKELVSKIEVNSKKPKMSAKKGRSLSQRQQQENCLNMMTTAEVSAEVKKEKSRLLPAPPKMLSLDLQDDGFDMISGSSSDPSPLPSSSSSTSGANSNTSTNAQLEQQLVQSRSIEQELRAKITRLEEELNMSIANKVIDKQQSQQSMNSIFNELQGKSMSLSLPCVVKSESSTVSLNPLMLSSLGLLFAATVPIMIAPVANCTRLNMFSRSLYLSGFVWEDPVVPALPNSLDSDDDDDDYEVITNVHLSQNDLLESKDSNMLLIIALLSIACMHKQSNLEGEKSLPVSTTFTAVDDMEDPFQTLRCSALVREEKNVEVPSHYHRMGVSACSAAVADGLTAIAMLMLLHIYNNQRKANSCSEVDQSVPTPLFHDVLNQESLLKSDIEETALSQTLSPHGTLIQQYYHRTRLNKEIVAKYHQSHDVMVFEQSSSTDTLNTQHEMSVEIIATNAMDDSFIGELSYIKSRIINEIKLQKTRYTTTVEEELRNHVVQKHDVEEALSKRNHLAVARPELRMKSGEFISYEQMAKVLQQLTCHHLSHSQQQQAEDDTVVPIVSSSVTLENDVICDDAPIADCNSPDHIVSFDSDSRQRYYYHMSRLLNQIKTTVVASSSGDDKVMPELVSVATQADDSENDLLSNGVITSSDSKYIAIEVELQLAIQENTHHKLTILALRDKLKQRARLSIDRITSLHQELASYKEKLAEANLQVEETAAMNFECQLEYQQCKQKLTAVHQDRLRIKDHYKQQMVEYQQRYNAKVNEVHALTKELRGDRDRFGKIKHSIRRIAQLKSSLFTSPPKSAAASSSTTAERESAAEEANATRHEDNLSQLLQGEGLDTSCCEGGEKGQAVSEPGKQEPLQHLQRLYHEEIQRRIANKEFAEDEALLTHLSSVQSGLEARLQAIALEDEACRKDARIAARTVSSQLTKRMTVLHEERALKERILDELRAEIHTLQRSLQQFNHIASSTTDDEAKPAAIIIEKTPVKRVEELRRLRMKVLQCESIILTLKQERAELIQLKQQTVSSLPEDSPQYRQLAGQLGQVTSCLSQVKKLNEEWRSKYETASKRIEVLQAQEQQFRHELEEERRHVLHLLTKTGGGGGSASSANSDGNNDKM